MTAAERWALPVNAFPRALVLRSLIPHAPALCRRCTRAFAVPLFPDVAEALVAVETSHAP